MEIKKHYAVNKEDAEFGKLFDLEDGGRVQVARLGNRRFKVEVVRLQKESVNALRVNSSEALTAITEKAMAKTILLDWEGITIDGVPLQYSHENSLMLLTEYPDFKEAISVISASKESFALGDVAEK